jgi:hypothetical protein
MKKVSNNTPFAKANLMRYKSHDTNFGAAKIKPRFALSETALHEVFISSLTTELI